MPETHTVRPGQASPEGVHAQCLAWRVEGAPLLGVCRKSKGHTDSAGPKRREHYDPDHDVRWTDEEAL